MSKKTESLEERVKQVASILVDWDVNDATTYDHSGALCRIYEILKPEFLQAWNEYLKKMKRKARAFNHQVCEMEK